MHVAMHFDGTVSEHDDTQRRAQRQQGQRSQAVEETQGNLPGTAEIRVHESVARRQSLVASLKFQTRIRVSCTLKLCSLSRDDASVHPSDLRLETSDWSLHSSAY